MTVIRWKGNTPDQLAEKITINKDQLRKLKDEVLIELAEFLKTKIQEKAPKKSGEYSGNWKVNDPQNDKITVTNPDGKLFTILEFTGKRPTAIEAKEAKALHFVIDGVDIFVKFSNPGGFSPQPHVVPSLQELGRNEGERIIKNLIKNRIPAFRG